MHMITCVIYCILSFSLLSKAHLNTQAYGTGMQSHPQR